MGIRDRYLGSAVVEVFFVNLSFEILFMVIIGGLGSVSGAFMGAAFIVLIPILITNFPAIFGISINAATVEHFNFMILGALIIIFLDFEPHGIATLWSIIREKLKITVRVKLKTIYVSSRLNFKGS